MSGTHRLILRGVLVCVSRPRTTLVIAGLLLIICVSFASMRLRISANQNDLFDPNVSFFRDWLAFSATFPENEALYVVVQTRDTKGTSPANPQSSTTTPTTSSLPTIAVNRWTAAADAIASTLRGLSEVRSVDHRVPINQLGSAGLLFDAPARVVEAHKQVQEFLPLVRLWGEKPSLVESVIGPTPMERFITGLSLHKADDQTASLLNIMADSATRALRNPTTQLTVGDTLPDLSLLDAADPQRLGYYYVPDDTDPSRHLLLIRVYPKSNYTSLTAISETIEAIRATVEKLEPQFPEFQFALTGRPALEADEMRTTDTDTRRSEIVALVAVFIALRLVLRSLWLALAGEIALGVGIGWTFGWATLSLGELNLLSIVFLLALIGIGMDYLVQILTRYRVEQSRRSHAKTIWIAVFRQVSAPINTACLGAAGAFLVAALTNFRGAAHLGIIAGGGLVLCLIAGYVVLPALLTLFPATPLPEAPPVNDLNDTAPAGNRHAWKLLISPLIWIALLLAVLPFAFRAKFDANLIALQSPDLESVQLVRKLQTWSAVVLPNDLPTLRAARVAAMTSPEVRDTESILTAYDNLDYLRDHAAEIPTIDWIEPATIKADHVERLANKLRDLAKHYDSPSSEQILARGALVALADAASGPDRSVIAARLSEWQVGFVNVLHHTMEQFNPPSFDPASLPHELRGHFLGTDGRFALHIYPKNDLWQPAMLKSFVDDIEPRLSPVIGGATLTGIAINIHHSTASIASSFRQATVMALVLIFILVLIDLRRVGQTLLAISVLALGLPMLVAVMGFFDITWNFANFFGLPILIGAGHEYGVFLVHRYRESLRDARKPWPKWDVSDRALLLCAYITCTSFGFFWWMADHRGLSSLGLVMSLGTLCIYLASVVALRPVLKWMLLRRSR